MTDTRFTATEEHLALIRAARHPVDEHRIRRPGRRPETALRQLTGFPEPPAGYDGWYEFERSKP